MKKKNTKKDFYKNVIITSECWVWTGALNKDGYGIFSYCGKTIRAHRLSYLFAKGAIKKGLFICHKCDVRNCVNPSHLYEGTAKDNNRDTVKRGNHVSWYKNRTHCKNGHEYTEQTVYFNKNENRRVCKICRRLTDKRRYENNRRR